MKNSQTVNHIIAAFDNSLDYYFKQIYSNFIHVPS